MKKLVFILFLLGFPCSTQLVSVPYYEARHDSLITIIGEKLNSADTTRLKTYADSILAAARSQDTTRTIVREGELSVGGTDTTSLSNRINLKLSSIDTASLSSRIDGKQASGSYQTLDGDLTAIAAMSATGTVRRTGADTWTATASDTAGLGTSLAAKAPTASPTFTGVWTGSASIRGTATFSGTGVRVAVYVPGTASGDVVVCTPRLATVVTTTNLTAFAKTDSLIFLRGASGTSGAVLNWILMR